MESGRSPPPSGVGGSNNVGNPPSGHTPSPASPPPQHTTCNCSNNGSYDNIKKIIINVASKYPHDDPVQHFLQCLLKVLMPLSKEITLLNDSIKALHSKLVTATPVFKRTINHHSPQQPTWSTITAGGLLAHPRLQHQGPALIEYC